MVQDVTQIVLVRHGQSRDNVLNRLSGWSDSSLTELGERQAERAAEWIARSFLPDVLYVSPLRRTRQTAEPLRRLIGLPVRIREELREIHFGDLDGLTIPEIERQFPGVWPIASNEINADYRFPNGEVRREFYARIQRMYEHIVAEHAGKSVVIVTHGGVISSLVAYLSCGDYRRWREHPVHNCGFVEIRARIGEHQIVRANVVEHLADLPVW